MMDMLISCWETVLKIAFRSKSYFGMVPNLKYL